MRTQETRFSAPPVQLRLTRLAAAASAVCFGLAFASAARAADGDATVAQAPATTLAPVTVTAQREDATGHFDGYAANRSATGTKTDTPIIETPQSISVVGADEIRGIGAQNLTDALGYVAGVNRLEGQDHTTDSFISRGFQLSPQTGNYLRDGTKFTVNPYNGQQELYGLERVELLKGASSVLYGAAAPGGIVNTVSKRPTIDPFGEVNVEFGSFARKQLSGDFGGALDADKKWSYRLTFLGRDADTAVDSTRDNRLFIAPALKYQPSADTSFTLLTQYQRDRDTYVYGLPTAGTILPNPNGRIPRNRFVGEPGYDKFDSTQYSFGYLFEHAFNDQLKLRNSVRYYHADNDFPSVWIGSGFEPDMRTTDFRGAQDRKDRSWGTTVDTSLEYKWASGPIQHTTLVGLDYTYQKQQTERYDRDAAPLDLFTPTYGQGLGDPVPSGASGKAKLNLLGLYAQDQMKIWDRLVLLAGLRQDWATTSQQPFFDSPGWENDRSTATTARAGLVYLFDNGIAPYLSFSQSFNPEVGRDRNGDGFKPSRGEQYEVGVRYQPKGRDLMLSAALYDLTQTNVLVTDPEDTFFQTQLGKVRSRGVELEARGRIGNWFNVIAAYAYTDARNVRTSPLTPELDGSRTGGVPYNMFSLWGDYSFGAFGIAGLKIGAGVRYVGETRGVFIDGSVPAFTLVDAMISYTTGPWRFAVNATNLTDKTYIASCTYGCFYGEPRKVIGTVTYRW